VENQELMCQLFDTIYTGFDSELRTELDNDLFGENSLFNIFGNNLLTELDIVLDTEFI
jgi:hypothetical protein